MSFSDAVTSCFMKSFNFSGRACRSEYWYFRLFSLLSIVLFGILLLIFVELSCIFTNTTFLSVITVFVYIPALLFIVVILPIATISVSIRRFHDIGISGWVYLLLLIVTGDIAVLILCILDSEPGDNKYGPNPKGFSEID
jgi:uncharacterized membrane protein YhaH (DUF805 family)